MELECAIAPIFWDGPDQETVIFQSFLGRARSTMGCFYHIPPMTWLALALGAAILDSTKDVFSKMTLQGMDEYVLTWSFAAFTTVFLVPFLWLAPLPAIAPTFWLALLFGGFLNTMAAVLYLQAIKTSDLSTTIPIVNFTPLLLLFTSPLIVKEVLSPAQALGGLLIVVGSYVLNCKPQQGHWLAPVRSLLQNRGSRLMLLVALTWSLTSNFDKLGIQSSSTLVWLVAIHLFIAVALFPLMLYHAPQQARQIPRNLDVLLPLALLNCLSVACQMTALALTAVVQVIAIKRLSTLISVVVGLVVFHESDRWQRLSGAAVMLLGVLCITWR